MDVTKAGVVYKQAAVCLTVLPAPLMRIGELRFGVTMTTVSFRLRGLFILLAFANSVASSPLQDTDENTEKRGLIEMAKIMEYYTKRSAFDYNGYGCYCGLGGSGVPVDAVDRCCQAHDNCYGRTSCWVTHLSWSTSICSGGRCVCQDKYNSCGYQACQCDVTLGQCLAGAPYIPSNKGGCKSG